MIGLGKTLGLLLRKDDKHVSTIKSLPPGKTIKSKTIKIHE